MEGGESISAFHRVTNPIVDTNPMDTKHSRFISKIKFRVLIIGRANAGKTTILQRVCDTTDSPNIYRQIGWRREQVRHGCLVVLLLSSYPTHTQVKLDPSMEVSGKRSCLLSPLNNSESAWRTQHQ